MTTVLDERAPGEAEALDAYSQVVTTVAERVLPLVAHLRVAERGQVRPWC